MLEIEVFVSPERLFYEYKSKMEKQLCQVCQNLAVGFHYGAYVCEACKKFFKRYLQCHNSESISCQEECNLDLVGRRKCADCRYKKCLRLGMRLSVSLSDKSDFDISKIPCRICGSKSSGFHFGSLTCEGCKGFFRRADVIKDRLVCSSKGECLINYNNRSMCKYCRYQQCLRVGMSKTGSRIGRQPNAVKHHCLLEISNYKDNSLLKVENSLASSETNSSRSFNFTQVKSKKKILGFINECMFSSTVSGSSDPQLKIFFSKIMEAMTILQMPFKKAMALLQITMIPLHKNQSLMEVWNMMMQHFEVHSHILIQFAKRIPIFNALSLVDKRVLVQESMYPIILLNLARSYSASESKFNYFDFTEQEYNIILTHFPTMDLIMTHVKNISYVVDNLEFNHRQIMLLCVIELLRGYHNLEAASTVKIFYDYAVRFCWASIIDQFMEPEDSGNEEIHEIDILLYLKSLNCPPEMLDTATSKILMFNPKKCLQKLRIVFVYFTQWLQKFNIEHQTIIDQLKIKNPELPYSELYTEMFQLPSLSSVPLS